MGRRHDQSPAIHRGAYVQAADPATTNAAGMQSRLLWIDDTSTPVKVYRRNEANDDWDFLGFFLAALTTRSIDAADAAEDSDDVIVADTSGGDFTLDLLALADRTGGRPLYVKNKGGVLTVAADGAETVNGAASIELADGDSVTIRPVSATEWETF